MGYALKSTIRAKIRPFQHDDSVADIVNHIAQITANLHSLNTTTLDLPRYTLPPSMNVKKLRSVTAFGAHSRGQYYSDAKDSEYDNVLPDDKRYAV